VAEEKEKKKKKKPLKRRVSKAKKETPKKEAKAKVKAEDVSAEAPAKAGKIEAKVEAKAEAVKEAAPEVKAEAPQKTAAKRPKKKKVEGQIFYGTGRRKTATARVYMQSGNGGIQVNGKLYKEYFCNRPVLLARVEAPLKVAEALSRYNIEVKVAGGGISSQAGAVSMGIARALNTSQPEMHKVLRQLDYLTRDPREKERKKYGRKRARRSFQYTKR